MKCNLLCESKYRNRNGACRALVVLALFVGGLFLHGSAVAAQVQAGQRITLQMEQATVEQVISHISETTNHKFLYRVEDLSGIRLRDYSFNGVNLEQVMDNLIDGTSLVWNNDEGTIVISRATPVQQQPARRTVTGVVKDHAGQPVPGATVAVRGMANIGTATDAQGRYSIAVAGDVTLEFSFVGMQSRQEVVGNRTTIDVTLVESETEITEVIVTGVFDRPMESFTGAANLITRQELQESSSQGLLTSLANIDPSFKFVPSNLFGSDPNKLNQAAITMRGGTALMDYQNDYANAVAANRPIFVIDGFVSSIDQFLALDESRVQSVTTLKDAAATALYGTRAANGVVVITTIQPAEGRLRVAYKGTFALEAPDLSSYNLMNGNEKLQFELESGLYDSENVMTDRSLKNLYYSRKLLVARGVDTDWLGFPLRNAFSHNHAVTLSGGEGALRYSLDIGNNRKSNVMKGSFNNTFNGVMYLNYSINNFVFSNRLSVTTSYGPNSPYGSFSDYTRLNAYYRPYDENGNPIKVMDRTNYQIQGDSAPGQAIALGSPSDIERNSRNPLYNAQLATQRSDTISGRNGT